MPDPLYPYTAFKTLFQNPSSLILPDLIEGMSGKAKFICANFVRVAAFAPRTVGPHSIVSTAA